MPEQSLYALLVQATELPKLSFEFHNDHIEVEPLDILHRRFDILTENLEQFEKQIAEFPRRPAKIIPITGAITGLAKYCRQVKAQREKQENINYVCYLHTYKYVYDQLLNIGKLAKQLQQTTLSPPILTNSANDALV